MPTVQRWFCESKPPKATYSNVDSLVIVTIQDSLNFIVNSLLVFSYVYKTLIFCFAPLIWLHSDPLSVLNVLMKETQKSADTWIKFWRQICRSIWCYFAKVSRIHAFSSVKPKPTLTVVVLFTADLQAGPIVMLSSGIKMNIISCYRWDH